MQQFALTIEEELVQLTIMQHVISEEVKKVEGERGEGTGRAHEPQGGSRATPKS